jgi:hypothetical protein
MPRFRIPLPPVYGRRYLSRRPVRARIFRRTERDLLGKVGDFLPSVQPFQDVLGFSLGFDEDVSTVHFGWHSGIYAEWLVTVRVWSGLCSGTCRNLGEKVTRGRGRRATSMAKPRLTRAEEGA